VKRLIVYVLLAVILSGCQQKTSKVEDVFKGVGVGDSRQCVVTQMGEPDGLDFRNHLGISAETVTWKEEGKIFKILFVQERVVSKQMRTAD